MPDLSAEQLVAIVRDAAARGLNLAAARVQAVTVPLTPIEYGDLRDSLTVLEATPEDLSSAVVSDLPYAVRQHEDLSLRHPKGGQAKFLEAAALSSQDDVQALIATTVRRALAD